MLKPFLIGCSILSVVSFAADTYEWGNVRFDGGGFVSAILPSPTVENLVYARTDVGGIYRFDATSRSWIPLMDWINEADKGLYGTESFALDPNDPKKLYVLAGTGYFSDGKTAILRSSDYGETFDTTYVEFLAHGNGMGRQTGEKLAVDPNAPDILFCGSRTKGLYKSTDAGKSWSKVANTGIQESTATGNSLTNVNGVSFVLFDKASGTLGSPTPIIYVGVSAQTNNFLISTDAGETWEQITGGPENLMPHRAVLKNGNIYLTYSSSEGPHSVSKGAVYKYDTKNKTWTNITPYQDGSTTSRMGDGSQSASHGFGGISIDPNDENHIIVTTLCFYGGRHLYADSTEGWGDRIYVTKDGGKTWTHGQGYNAGINISAGDNKWIHGNAIHWAGSIEFNPFNTKQAWVTSGNGVFFTEDISAEVPVWKFESKGIEETVPLDIVSVKGGPLVTAIGDYDGATYTDITKSTPRHNPSIGTTNSLGYAPLANAFVRTGSVTDYSGPSAITTQVMYYSKDNATTWKKLETTLEGAQGLVVLSADGEVILHRPDQSASVYYSDDKGKSWNPVTGLDGQSQYARIVSDPVNENVFYLVDSQGYLLKSTDKGKSFEKFGERLQNDALGIYYNGGGLIRTVPGKEGHLWVPLDQSQVWLQKGYSENGLAYSENGGTSWTRLSSVFTAISVGLGKPATDSDYETIFIWGVAGNKENPLGIYRSTDKGETWERINDDMHQFGGPGNGNFVVGDMNNYGVVYMSTIGRGLIVGAIKGTILPIQKENLPLNNFAQIQLANKKLSVQLQEDAILLLFDIQGNLKKQVRVQNNSSVDLSKLSSGTLIAKILNNKGKVLLQEKITLK